MKNKNKQNGITLVALIVTIIILIILAGISIASLTGNGLFEKAKLAKEKQENAQIEEDKKLGDYENKIGQYIDGNRDTNNFSMTELLSEPAIVPTSTTGTTRDLNFQLNDSILNYKILLITYGVWNNSTSKLGQYTALKLPVSQIIISEDNSSLNSLEVRNAGNFSVMNINFSANNNIHVFWSMSSSSTRNYMAITSVIGIK